MGEDIDEREENAGPHRPADCGTAVVPVMIGARLQKCECDGREEGRSHELPSNRGVQEENGEKRHEYGFGAEEGGADGEVGFCQGLNRADPPKEKTQARSHGSSRGLPTGVGGKEEGKEDEGHRPRGHGVVGEDVDPLAGGAVVERALEFQITDRIEERGPKCPERGEEHHGFGSSQVRAACARTSLS